MKEKLYDLTAPQRSILVTEQYFKGSSINHICGTAFLYEKIDFDVLEQALNLLVKYNDSLRIRMVLEENEMKQTVNEYVPFNIETVEVSSKDGVSTIEANLMKEPFDMYSNLFTCKMFRMPDGSGGFSVNIHHLVSDSWTLGLVAKEVVRIYSSIIHHEEIDVSSISSYVDYISAEQEYRASDKFKKDKAYWDSVFENIPESASIPSSKEDADSFSCKANRLSFTISKKEMEQINTYCKDAHISAFNFFMGLYAIYTSRVSGIEDFVMGTPILNRTNFKEKNTMGMFINVVPLRLNLTENLSFGEFASRIAKSSFEMMRHQKYSYQYILEDLRKKDASLPNLYHILMSYQITKASEESGVPYDTRWAFNGNVNDDLEIHLYDLNDTGCIDIAYDYRTDKYEESEIRVLHERMLHMIHQVLERKDIGIHEIEIVTSKEKYEILYGFNDTDLGYDDTIPFIHFFEQQAILHPKDIALTFRNQQMTYETLNKKANSLAFLLRKNNVSHNSIVGIMVDRSFEMIISILAVLKSGGGYLPIDPDYPDNRINYMIEDSNCSILLTMKNLKKNTLCSNTLFVDLNQEFYAENTSNLDLISSPDDLSYLIYTSGSTGLPKGVMLTQKSLSNFYHAMKQKISYLVEERPHRIVSITTVSFDIFAFETLISLANGLHLFITDNLEQKSTKHLEELVFANKIEIIQTTPSVMKFHLDNLEEENHFSCLKYVILAGEQLPIELVKQIKRISPNCIIYNGYGPSETTIFSSVQDVSDLDAINIGNPIANTQFYILDTHKNLLPKHHIGEIYIAGDGLGNGYLAKPDLTNKSFLPNPFCDGSLFYRTGDLGLWLDNGCIACKGRVDYQVKLRGLRIELGEIESKINTYQTGIKSAIIVRNEKETDFLYAFIESKEPIDTSKLKSFLISCLPNYMIPSRFVILDKLPQTPNGKTDRKALKTYPVEGTVQNTKLVSPKDDWELRIFNLIVDVIKNYQFSMLDDFFSIGMDSLNLIRFTTKIEKEFDVQIPIRKFYDFASILDFCVFLRNAQKSVRLSPVKIEKQNYYPLSTAQSRIYYASQLAKNSTLYNVSGGILINSILDVNKIKTSFQKIIQLHSSFRTSFQLINSEPVQIILNNFNFDFDVLNSKETDLTNIIDTFPKPFNLEIAPLLRVCVHFLDHQKTLILIDSHHIIVDGTSLNILIRDFWQLYTDIEISKNTFDYVDYAVWEKEFLKSDMIQDKENYWVNYLKHEEIPIINLPYDYNMPAITSYVGNRISKKLPSNIFSHLENLSKQLGCSSYMLFLATFYLLLYKYTSQQDIIIGTPFANRPSSEFQNVIGMFVNNITLKSHIDSTKTFRVFLNDIKNLVLDALTYQPYPYDLLVKKLNLNGKSLFDVMFTYQNTKNDLLLFENTIEKLDANTKTAKFPLSLEIVPNTNIINLEYRTDLFKEETICRMLNHYCYLLENIKDNLDYKISDISILSKEDKHQILYDFNNTKLDYPSEKTIAELFEEQVLLNPNSTAIIYDKQNLTYKELNEKANQLAYHLSSMGIHQGDVVGVCLNRSIELLVSICAIFKLGATYMPMCTEYPKDRLIYMLKNSNSRLLITNSTMNTKYDFSFMKTKILNSVDDIDNEKNQNLCMHFPSSTIAYIIYTSGSTGKPKGVQISNRNLIHFVYAFKQYFGGISKEDTFLSSTNISFDVSIFELFLPILSGAKLVLYPEEVIRNISLYCNTIIDNEITGLYIPPNLLNDVYHILKDVPIKINKILVGVESIRKSTLNKYLKLLPNAKIINGYGPTETTICCTAFDYTLDETNDDFVSIGHPLFNNQIYILSQDKDLQPVGIVGELYVAGDGVGAGYINDPEKTLKSYVPNLYGSSSATMYKTGDLAKWNPDGTICFIGRNDSQVKISGHRIELKEISHVIDSYPNIAKSFSTTYHFGSTTGIVTYFTADKEISIKDLTAFLKSKLADYMIPTFILQIDQFPLTANGKIDKDKLPKNFVMTKNDYVSPRNPFEASIANIWKKLFFINKVGIDDNFFDLGGDSLIAIKFQVEAMNMGLNITYSDIFAYPTIRQLSEKSTNSLTVNDKNDTYDYSKINELIAKNKIENISLSQIASHSHIGNILLIGATGFLGAHLLDNYLSTQTGIAYCLIREKNALSPEDRLRKMLQFYFGDKYNSLFGERIIVLNGDITVPKFNLYEADYTNLAKHVDIVINSAALVKHYGNYQLFNDTNVLGTTNIIDFCETFHKKLYHISTLSVSGSGLLDKEITDVISFHENEFYIGQDLNNIYIYTKFEAEKLIFERILSGKLSGCILRIGNISNRYSDGKFQINVTENAFANRMKSILNLGLIQEKFLEHAIEFTPVDVCSQAIMKIIASNPMFSVFHLFNSNLVGIDTLLDYFNDLNIKLSCVDDKTFASTVNRFLYDDNLRNDITGIITDLDHNRLLDLMLSILPNSNFTEFYLKQLNFEWPKIDIDYIKKYINYFNSINFFN